MKAWRTISRSPFDPFLHTTGASEGTWFQPLPHDVLYLLRPLQHIRTKCGSLALRVSSNSSLWEGNDLETYNRNLRCSLRVRGVTLIWLGPTFLGQRTSDLPPNEHPWSDNTYMSGRVKIGPVPVRSDAHSRHGKDILPRSETENPRNVVFPRRHPARILHMAASCAHRADPWVPELVRVRGQTYGSYPWGCDEPRCIQCYHIS